MTDAPMTTDRPAGVLTAAAALPEMRWAAAATGLFLVGALLQLAGAPTATWWAAYLGCYATGGWQPAREGLRALRSRTLDVDLLMIVAALLAASIGQVLDGALLIVIFATSGALEALAARRTRESVRSLLDLAPQRARRVLPEGSEELVAAAELQVGELVRVRPGEMVGADGVVVDGRSDVDQASITGEPLPVLRGVGDEVFAGSLNTSGALLVRVERAASDSVVARIVALVDDASATKATTQLFIEKVEQRYSVGVVLATLALFAVPLLLGARFEPTLLRAMTFMIVASPCAVVLATMPPLLATIANAGRHGVLIKSAVALEQLADVDVVAFDKTGTLTRGVPEVVAVEPWGDDTVERVLGAAASAELRSEHPLGRAVVRAARDRLLDVVEPSRFDSTPGRGVTALVSGARVEVGSPAVVGHLHAAAAQRRRWHEAQGRTVVAVVVDATTRGLVVLADEVRPEAPDVVHELRRMLRRAPVLLTGDNRATARHLGARVGIEQVEAGLLPHQKVEAVRRLGDGSPRVVVVGDGVNDAPAMAAAAVGVAMGRQGSDLALETADVVLVRDDLRALVATMRLARRARRVVVANLVIAFTVIAVLVGWDLVGHLPLPLGVAGHEGSTILVALNGLRLLRSRAWPG